MVNPAEPGGSVAVDPIESDPPPPRRSRVARVLLRTVQLLAGLAVGCGIAEAAFWWRDHGAFPHLNVYVASAELGVRLRPHATERIAFGPNAPTSVTINAQGFRGDDWPAPGDSEVLVVGDSQVFGLGVEESQTTSAQLEGLLPGRRVLNAGVPTYGPPEYTKVVAEVLAKRHPKSVILVVNFANDLFEASQANKDRHAVWDGWAVHREAAPDHITSFPGRELLYGRSHAFYALRRFWYAHGPRYDDRAFSPKRTWQGIALAALAAEDEHEKAMVDTEKLAHNRAEAIEKAAAEAKAADSGVDRLIAKTVPGRLEGRNAITYRAARANPGDIVGYIDVGEWDEPVVATAELIREGAQYRASLEALIREKAKANPELAADLDRTLQDRATTSARFDAARKEPALVARAWSPITPSLREIKKLCDAREARLYVVALPLDVQISPEEWKKYGEQPVDMSSGDLLVADLLESALALGATPIDPTETLRAAEPGAFLYGDIHMTPKGHRALAELIAKTMKEAAPLPKPRRGLAAGRTRVPGPNEWDGIREVIVHGSDAAQCRTHKVREWLRVLCKMNTPAAPKPLGIKVVEGGHGEAFVTAAENVTALLVPVLAGDHFAADFSWSDRTQRLTIHWASDAAFPEMVFQPPSSKAPSETPAPLDLEPFCGCLRSHDAEFSCAGRLLAPSPDCARTYGVACDKLLACVEAADDSLPTCPAGQANAGTTGRCYALCSEAKPCAAGICTEWQGGRVCM